ncbi:uncharacterized protein LOC144158081 [Haemaphysalis longicornis]
MEEQEDDSPRAREDDQESRAQGGISVAVRLRRCTERINRLEKRMDGFEHRFIGRSTIEHCATEVVIGKKKESFLLINIYSNPTHRHQKFKTLMHKVLRTAQTATIAICGDFNASRKELGYHRTTVKGRDLLDAAADAGFTLHTDTAAPTRIGTSVTHDTNPDLAFVRTRTSAKKGVEWRNTGHNLGSDHFIIELDLPTSAVGSNGNRRKHKLTDWTRFRAECLEPQGEITDIEKWSEDIVQATSFATTQVETDEEMQQIDSRLAHMIEARQSLQRRWRRQRHNRTLRKRVAELGSAIEKYSRELCTQHWHAICSEADGQLHQGRTWKLPRHLLDETKSKWYQQHRLAQIMHTTIKKLGYHGPANPTLDRDIDEWEVRAALQNVNCKSAAGPDRVTNKALRNLNDGAIAALTAYFNRCWRAGTLPRQWKSAFDKVRHSAILAQVSRLGLGERTYNYIRDFLSHRTVEIQTGDLQLPERGLGSVGTPQGSVISPVLFNLVVIRVVQRLSVIPQVRYTIYADDITLWVPGGSEGHIEMTLQEAVDAIEDHLANTGLRCSPQKSKLLIIPPPGRYRKKAEEDSTTITLRTGDGVVIPKPKQRATVDRVITELGIATRLIKRISTRRHGMKETSLLRLVQSFAMSLVAYVGAFHPWKKHERDKINAAIRKT